MEMLVEYDLGGSRTGEAQLRTELARSALEQYGMQDANVALIRARGGGTLVFRASSSGTGKDFLLKMYLPPRSERRALSRSEDALRSQLLWQSALRREAELPVQEPVLTSEGELTSLARADGSAEPRIAVLMSWVPGEQKAPEELSRKELRMMGAHTARLHRHAESYAHPEGFVRPQWGWRSTFGGSRPLWKRGREFYSADEMAIFRAASEYVRRDLRSLGKGNGVYGLIHRDIQAKNLVFDGEQVHAIDFESCGWGHYLFDLALISLRLEWRGEEHAGLHEALLEGYRRVRPLSRNHEQYLETFAVMRIVERLNVLLRLEDPASHHQGRTYLPEAAKRLERFVETKRNRDVRKLFPVRVRYALGRLKTALYPRRTTV